MATKKPVIKLLFFSPYFYPYISGLTQYPYRLFTESGLPLNVTCLTFRHLAELKNTEKMSLRGATGDVAISGRLLRYARNDIGLRILRMPFLFRLSKGFISPQSLSYFWTETKKNDVVMINLPSIEGLVLAFFAKIQNRPLTSLLHCEVLLPPSPLNAIINFALNCGVFLQLLLSKKIIVYTKDYYEKKWMYSFFRNKMEVILPPVHQAEVDKEYTAQLKELKKDYKYAVGFCGRVAAEKGIEVLVESASSLRNVILYFAGPTGKDVVGEELYFKIIEQLLSEKKIPHVFLGTLSGKKISSFYRAVDVLVLPSLNKTEAFGMVQAEAMLQGTPVVASNLPGVRMPIHMTNMGILITPGSSSELAQGILTILNNKSQYSNPHLIHHAQAVFDSQKTYASIYSVLQS